MIYEVALTRQSTVTERAVTNVEADDEAGARSKALSDAEGDMLWEVQDTLDSTRPDIESVDVLADGDEELDKPSG